MPPPTSPRGASPRVVGTKDDVAYTVELVRLDDEVRTRISATATRGRAPVLSVLQQGVFMTTKEPVLRIGDDAFDAAYLVTKGTSHDAEGLRQTTRALLLLADRRRGVWLSSDGLKVMLSWRGAESDPLVLDAARDAVVGVAAWHRPESPYR